MKHGTAEVAEAESSVEVSEFGRAECGARRA